MQVKELRKILENAADDMDIIIEYIEGPHVYVKEDTFGVRIEPPHQFVILGVSENTL